MNNRSIAGFLIIACGLASSAVLTMGGLTTQSLDAVDFWMEPVSLRTVYADCNAGDLLYGTFEVKQDGDLFPGDQTKYDIWLIEGVDFYIFDELSYNLWVEDGIATALYANNGVSHLSWSIKVPESGRWYVVYSNDSVFRKLVSATTTRQGNVSTVILVVGPVLVACFVVGFLKLRWFSASRQPVPSTAQLRGNGEDGWTIRSSLLI